MSLLMTDRRQNKINFASFSPEMCVLAGVSSKSDLSTKYYNRFWIASSGTEKPFPPWC
jgi:hypothetical protein